MGLHAAVEHGDERQAPANCGPVVNGAELSEPMISTGFHRGRVLFLARPIFGGTTMANASSRASLCSYVLISRAMSMKRRDCAALCEVLSPCAGACDDDRGPLGMPMAGQDFHRVPPSTHEVFRLPAAVRRLRIRNGSGIQQAPCSMTAAPSCPHRAHVTNDYSLCCS